MKLNKGGKKRASNIEKKKADINGNDYRWRTRDVLGTWYYLYAYDVYSIGSWTHICNTYEGSIFNKSVYVDGSFVDSQIIPDVRSSTARWCIGSYGGGGYLDGLIYQPLWFDRILSDSEINQIYSNNYFVAGSGEGNITSVILSSGDNINEITSISWTEVGVGGGNTINVQVSADNGVNWYDVINGGSLSSGSFVQGNQLKYMVLFNSVDAELSIDEINISWTENYSISSLSVSTLWDYVKSLFDAETAVLSESISGMSIVEVDEGGEVSSSSISEESVGSLDVASSPKVAVAEPSLVDAKRFNILGVPEDIKIMSEGLIKEGLGVDISLRTVSVGYVVKETGESGILNFIFKLIRFL